MEITSSIQGVYQSLKRTLGEAVVGSDFTRQDGTIDGIVLGAGAGAVVGGVIGGARGLLHQTQNRVSEELLPRSITDPKLESYRYSVRADWDRDCHTHGEHTHCERELDGWWHSYSPDIRERVVGGFTEPVLRHSHQATLIGSAFSGAAIGTGVGAGLGLATGVLGRLAGGHPLRRKPLPPEIREQMIMESGEMVLKSTALGAGVGAAAGLGAGFWEQSRAVSVERTWDAPVYEQRNLGFIPRNHYEWNRSWDWASPGDYRHHSPHGERPVIREAPLLDSGGRPVMKPLTRQLDSTRFGPVSGLLGGAAVGAGLGFATGVASTIVNRLLLQAGTD